MPEFEKTVARDSSTMTFRMPRMSWKEELAKITLADPDVAHLFILDERENFTDERRQALEAAAELKITIRCGQNRSQTPPLDRQFYVVRTA